MEECFLNISPAILLYIIFLTDELKKQGDAILSASSCAAHVLTAKRLQKVATTVDGG